MIGRVTAMMVGWGLMMAGGCGTPLVHSAAPAGEGLRDEGLVGRWVTADPGEPTQVQVTVGPGTADTYEARLSVTHEGRVKTSDLPVEVRLTRIGEDLYADLFLAREERDRLVNTHGFLVIPVHQLMKVRRDGDELRVWSFDPSWLERVPGGRAVAQERVTVGGGQVTLVTAPLEELREMVARHAKEAGAFSAPMVLRRTGR